MNKRSEAAKILGSAKSEAKTAAARRNAPLGGAAGGRPALVFFDLNGKRVEEVYGLRDRLNKIVEDVFGLAWPRATVRANTPWMRVNVVRNRISRRKWMAFIAACRSAAPEYNLLGAPE